MAIIAKSGQDFVLAPEGTYAAVCVDMIDLGKLTSSYSGDEKPYTRAVWQLSELQENGRPYTVVRRYHLSTHPDAALTKDLQSWLGRQLTKEESKSFDVENMLGKACLLNIVHTESNGKTYSNVQAIMPLPKDMKAPTPYDYIRQCDRENGVVSAPKGTPPQHKPKLNGAPAPAPEVMNGVTEDDVPF
jgi:hypothetical protein